MAGYNRIVLIGNLTRDPEYKQLASGQAVCRLGLATNRQFKNRQSGSMVQEVCYVDIDVWGAQAESCRQYLQKGRQVLIEGRLKFDTWEDPNGQSRNKHSVVADRVVFLSSGASDDQASDQVADTRGATLSDSAGVARDSQDKLEKGLMDQIDKIKMRAKPAKEKQPPRAEKGNAPTGEIEFKDQPPFEDDLPF